MKHIITLKACLSIMILIAIVLLDSCKGGDPDPGNTQAEADRVTGLLTSGQWKMKSLTVDGVAKGDYPNLVIAFSKTNFSSTGGSPVWPTTGTWTFTDAAAKTFTRDDQTIVAIESIDQGNVTLSLTWSQTSIGPGRVMSVAGKYVFVFGK